MRGVIMHSPGEVRVQDRDDPQIVEPTDAIIKVTAACVCGSDLWPYRGANPITDALRQNAVAVDGDLAVTVEAPADAAEPDAGRADRSRVRDGARPDAAVRRGRSGRRGRPRR